MSSCGTQHDATQIRKDCTWKHKVFASNQRAHKGEHSLCKLTMPSIHVENTYWQLAYALSACRKIDDLILFLRPLQSRISEFVWNFVRLGACAYNGVSFVLCQEQSCGVELALTSAVCTQFNLMPWHGNHPQDTNSASTCSQTKD